MKVLSPTRSTPIESPKFRSDATEYEQVKNNTRIKELMILGVEDMLISSFNM
jgi:hypothetical protein